MGKRRRKLDSESGSGSDSLDGTGRTRKSPKPLSSTGASSHTAAGAASDSDDEARIPPVAIETLTQRAQLDIQQLLDEIKAFRPPSAAGASAGSSSSSSYARCGTIESVEMVNFMKFKSLEIKFGPGVNFICGRNGSGKSTIVAAIMLGLGASTKTTGRGDKLTDLVGKHLDAARVTIRLCNSGDDPFEPERYGQTIVVERTLNRGKANATGSSKYRIFGIKDGAETRTFGKSAKVLGLIVDHFRIDVSNPYCVLDQTTSQEFMDRNDPSSLFKYYWEGTGLAAAAANLDELEENFEKAQAILKEKVEVDLPKMKAEYLEMKERNSRLKPIKDMERKLNAARDALAWAYVIREEKQIAKLEEQINKYTQRGDLEKHRAKLRRSLAKVENANNRLGVIREAIGELTDKLEEARSARSASDRTYRDARETHTNDANAVTENEEMITRLQGVLAKNETQLDELRAHVAAQNSRGTMDAHVIRRQKAMSSLESELEAAISERRALDGESADIGARREAAQTELEGVVTRARQLKDALRRSHKHLNDMRQSKKDMILRFAPSRHKTSLARLLDEIQANAGAFSRPPIGPVGNVISVSDPRWAASLQAVIKLGIFSFIVKTSEDYATLRKLCHKVRYTPFPTIHVFPAYDEDLYAISESDRVPSSLTTMLDVIVGDTHPTVVNFLTDQYSIHRKVLVESVSAAKDLVANPQSARQNVTYAVDPDGTIVENRKGTLATFRAPGFPVILGSTSVILESAEADIAAQSKEIDEAHGLIARYENELTALKRASSELRTRIKRADGTIRSLKEDIERLREKEEVSVQDEIDTLETAIGQTSNKLKVVRARLERARDAEAESLAEESAAAAERSEAQAAFDAIVSKIKESEDELETTANRINELVSTDIPVRRAKVEKVEAHLADLAEAKDKAMEDMALYEERARSERVEPTQGVTQLVDEIKELEANILSRRAAQGDAKAIRAKYKEYRALYEQTLRAIDIAQVEVAMEKKHRDELKVYIDNMIHTSKRGLVKTFGKLLKFAGFSGSMDPDSTRQRLNIAVSVPNQADTSKRPVKQLSGGERSLVMVSYLLSLWAVIDGPFGVMDEADVFMDATKRELSMQLMVDMTKKQIGMQTVFLVPSAPPITGDDVTIFEMPAPVPDDE